MDNNENIIAGGAFSIGGGPQLGAIRILAEQNNAGLATNVRGYTNLLRAQAGKKYLVQTSNDLNTWVDHETVIATAAGVQVLDPSCTSNKKRFFRAVLVQ